MVNIEHEAVVVLAVERNYRQVRCRFRLMAKAPRAADHWRLEMNISNSWDATDSSKYLLEARPKDGIDQQWARRYFQLTVCVSFNCSHLRNGLIVAILELFAGICRSSCSVLDGLHNWIWRVGFLVESCRLLFLTSRNSIFLKSVSNILVGSRCIATQIKGSQWVGLPEKVDPPQDPQDPARLHGAGGAAANFLVVEMYVRCERPLNWSWKNEI